MTPEEKRTLITVRAHVSACSIMLRLLATQFERAGMFDRASLLDQFDRAYLRGLEESPLEGDARETAILAEDHFRTILGAPPRTR